MAVVCPGFANEHGAAGGNDIAAVIGQPVADQLPAFGTVAAGQVIIDRGRRLVKCGLRVVEKQQFVFGVEEPILKARLGGVPTNEPSAGFKPVWLIIRSSGRIMETALSCDCEVELRSGIVSFFVRTAPNGFSGRVGAPFVLRTMK